MPTQPNQSENTISSNEIDFSDELPLESEYYRTSTDRDDFVRPIPSIDGNEIDDDGTGVDLNEDNGSPECTYGITVTVLCENESCNNTAGSVHVKNVEIQTRNLILRTERHNKLSLNEFVRKARKEIIETIKSNNNYSNEMLNNIINYLREMFAKTYGYEDNCGISVTLNSEFGTQEEVTDSIEDLDENKNTESFEETNEKINPDDVEVFNVLPTVYTTESDEATTEPYESRVLTKPKLSGIVQEAIDVYRALNNWKYPSQA